MTATELKTEFLIGYDKVSSFAAPGYTDSEISTFLSQAQERFVKQRYTPKGNKYQDGFEETEKRRKDLEGVIMLGTGTLSADQSNLLSTNSVAYDLPTDHWLTIIEWVATDNVCSPTVKVVSKTHDEYFAIIDDPFKKPSSDKAFRLDLARSNGNKRYEIITDGSYNINNYFLRYIKELVDIDITNNISSELHNMTHREIVNIAVTIALENTQEPRVQSHMGLGQQVE